MKIKAAVLAVLLSAPAACPAGETAPAPAGTGGGKYKGYNLLMISMTNIGTERMSLYGYQRDTTPKLSAWAAASGAFVFEDAFTPASWTLPVATSLFTSLYPYSHNIMGRDRNMRLAARIKTLPELMRTAGYETAAFTGGLDYMKKAGHMRGFATAPDNPSFTCFSTTTAQAAEWLSKHSGEKFFLFLHGYDPHPPFTPSKKFSGVFASTEGKHVTVDPAFTYRGYRRSSDKDMTVFYHIPRMGPEGGKLKKEAPRRTTVLKQADIDYLSDLYDEKILDVDLAVSGFLASLDKALLDRTIVVVFSEHGEMFAKHGRFGRAGAKEGTLYDEVVHVPLLIRLPGETGHRVRGLAEIVDIMPTLSALLEFPLPENVQGTSLLPLMREGKAVNDFVYAGARYNTYVPEPDQAYDVESVNEYIRSGAWKLIHEVTLPDEDDKKQHGKPQETYELYDLGNDPGETKNAAAANPGVLKDLRQRLRQWSEAARKRAGYRPARQDLPADVREKAKQHGYW